MWWCCLRNGFFRSYGQIIIDSKGRLSAIFCLISLIFNQISLKKRPNLSLLFIDLQFVAQYFYERENLMNNKNSKPKFSGLNMLISILIGWAIFFFGAWACMKFSSEFFAMPRFIAVIIVSIAGAVVIGPAIYGFLYLGRKK